jgi:hypothetical protein
MTSASCPQIMVFYCKFVLQANAFSAREAHAGVPRKQHPCLNFQVSRFLVQVDYFRVARHPLSIEGRHQASLHFPQADHPGTD